MSIKISIELSNVGAQFSHSQVDVSAEVRKPHLDRAESDIRLGLTSLKLRLTSLKLRLTSLKLRLTSLKLRLTSLKRRLTSLKLREQRDDV